MGVSNPFPTAGAFLVQALFSFFAMIILARIILQWVRADFYNPIAQAVMKLSNPVILRMRRYIPSIRNIDTSSVLLLYLVTVLKLFLVFLIKANLLANLFGLLIWSIGDILDLITMFYTYAILAQIIISWINRGQLSSAVLVIYQMTEPLMSRFRKIAPPIGGLDLSPMAALLCIQLFAILIANPIIQFGAMNV